ncbi:phosphate signaling complex protein PhoU [Thiolapillus brandeum]|uniref:Phosphate-specific transport system accessory protein PhoU n=1 Tax=Thiolapillus brandeum TaxID=1076588 RepID=A0A7U6GKD6_9GAMM|nr:phosphate signaling complex protein PhoU [Thiolapillus brandeum]BAO45270.1 phosphate transport system regulator [Thiolapillus brandeum]
MTTPHRLLTRAEAQVHQNLFTMTSRARQALEQSLEALKTQNAELAQEVVNEDLQQNHLMRIIERECLQILATLEPKAGDLREVVASLQIAAELERIADHAKDIANIVLSMDPSDFSGPMDRIAAMGDLCQNMLVQVMESYENLDAALAEHVASHDKQVDELDEEASSSLMMTLMTSADTSMHCTHLLWIAYHLERIGDRVTNVAERVVFMVTAETPDLG